LTYGDAQGHLLLERQAMRSTSCAKSVSVKTYTRAWGMTQLLDGSLMVGGLEECFQRQNHVYTHALNCASEIQLCNRVDAIGFKCGVADDCDETDIRDILGGAVAFIADARSHGGLVFVHCLQSSPVLNGTGDPCTGFTHIIHVHDSR
jgi:hypothetical protein